MSESIDTQNNPKNSEELKDRVRSVLYVDAGQSQIPDRVFPDYEFRGTDAILALIHSEVLAVLGRLKEPTINDIFPSKPYDGSNTYEDMNQVVKYYKGLIEAEESKYGKE